MDVRWGVAALALAAAGMAPCAWGAATRAPASFAGGIAALRTVVPENVPLVAPPPLPPETGSGAPLAFATRAEVHLGPENAGQWELAPDGSSIWRVRIASPGARSLNLGFTTFDLPPGAAMWLYRPDRSEVSGPYTAADATPGGQLWTPVIGGDEIVVEVSAPAPSRSRVRLVIEAVNQGYRDLVASAQSTSYPCYTDVVCPKADPWRDQVNAVALYSIGGVIACTGTLLDDTSHDFRPFFLTAHHCLNNPADAETVVVYWNYQSPVCGQHGGGSLAQHQSGATLRATWGDSDFTLIELLQRPAQSFHVYYAGWDATGNAPTSAVVINQPKAEKVITFANHPILAVNTSFQTDPPLLYWLVDPYTDGTTDNGSSGSCLFDENKRCVGTLIDGTPASCVSTTDYYGRLSMGWQGGGTADTSLRAWLDAKGTGELTLQGTATYVPVGRLSRALRPSVH